jgi:hypothetical protein
MVLMAFVGFVQANSGNVSVSPDVGTRGETLESVSLMNGDITQTTVDQNGNPINQKPWYQDSTLQSVVSDNDLVNNDKTEVITPDGKMILEVDRQMARMAELTSSANGEVTYDSDNDNGQIIVRTRAIPGWLDADGPYGGPDCFEGSCTVHFTVVPHDNPNILMFRWDFNNDGVFDYPKQVSPGLLGDWVTYTEFDYTFYDNFYTDIVVQGWDGISTYIVINTGTILGGLYNFNLTWTWIGATYRLTGNFFKAKKSFTITDLGYYQWPGYTYYKMYIWIRGAAYPAGRLGLCDPTHINSQWNWCTLPTAVNIVAGTEYWLGQRIESTHRGWTTAPPPLANNPYITHLGVGYIFCYLSDPDQCNANTLGSSTYALGVDFKYRETLVLPDVVSAKSHLDVRNVAPTVWGVRTDPSPGLEGTPIKFYATFQDPGSDDTWQYRWLYPGGVTGPWVSVDKLSGGARVLILSSWSGDDVAIQTALTAMCGTFCIKVDRLDFGPGSGGQNRVPTLAELLPYDVLVVGTNYGAIPDWDQVGNVIADYMDKAGPTGGGVVMMFAAFYTANTYGIRGRWQTDSYSPLAPAAYTSGSASLGTIYVPGHPILDGVASMSATFKHTQTSVTPGATRVADFTTGTVLAATKTNPIVSNGARAVALPWFPTSSYGGGDYMRVLANAVKWASRQPDPVVKTMPIEFGPYERLIPDDDPTTTTPIDPVPVSVQVQDDDNGKFVVYNQNQLSYNDFNDATTCYWASPTVYSWPTGWSANPSHGWRCEANANYGSRAASILWDYNDPVYGTGNGISDLYTPTYDFTGFNLARLEFDTDWYGPMTPGPSDGYVHASIDGGATYPILLKEYHSLNPSRFTGHVTIDSYALGGQSNVKFRFEYVSHDDVWWFVDNVRVTGFLVETINGLGEASGTAMVANVPPTIVGGFDSAYRLESQGLDFTGFKISDPALRASTEWFAYSWNMGDGTPTKWYYKGTMTPPKFSILLIHSLDTSSCGTYCTAARNMLLALDDVALVDTYNFFQSPPTAPSLTVMMNYDIIMVAMNNGWIGSDPWDTARRLTGDRIASYLEAGRGGVVTWFGPYIDDATNGPIWDLFGRFRDWDYGPYERALRIASAGTLGPIFDPNHDVMTGVRTGQVTLQFTQMGQNALSIGGLGLAAGRNGVNLADNAAGGRAVGVKELTNGKRAVHIGAFMANAGADMPKLARNAIGWAAGGIPNEKIPAFTFPYGDNGVYKAELDVIDDDMGYIWDPVNSLPVQVIPGMPYTQRTMTVTVDNVDPTIIPSGTGGFGAFIASTVCVRVSGQAGNSVTVDIYEDGTLVATTTTIRTGSDPNPDDEKCGLFKIDVLKAHTYEATITYDAPNGGSNPTWLIFNPWRDPVTPGHGTVSWKYDLDKGGQVITQPLSTLKGGLLDHGQGAKIDFSADAYDSGTDDLAFFWMWGAVTNSPYQVPNDPTMVYQINVHHNNGMPTSDGILADPQHLGFSEPFFDRAANTGTSPIGTMNYRVHDTAVHAFDMEQTMYYVVLIVFDDDNGRGYASPFQTDGIDMDFIFLDLS